MVLGLSDYLTQDFEATSKSGKPVKVLGVRPETEFGICQFPSSTSMYLPFLFAFTKLITCTDVPLNRFVANPS
jgi:hypothetical protein